MTGAGILFILVIIVGGWLVSTMRTRLFRILGVITLGIFAIVLYYLSTSNTALNTTSNSPFDTPIERGMHFK